jgi:hypothetical protein
VLNDPTHELIRKLDAIDPDAQSDMADAIDIFRELEAAYRIKRSSLGSNERGPLLQVSNVTPIGEELRLKGHLAGLAIDPLGRYLITAVLLKGFTGPDGVLVFPFEVQVRRIQPEGMTTLATLRFPKAGSSLPIHLQIAISADGGTFAFHDDREVHIYRVKENADDGQLSVENLVMERHPDIANLRHLALNHDGTVAALSGLHEATMFTERRREFVGHAIIGQEPGQFLRWNNDSVAGPVRSITFLPQSKSFYFAVEEYIEHKRNIWEWLKGSEPRVEQRSRLYCRDGAVAPGIIAVNRIVADYSAESKVTPLGFSDDGKLLYLVGDELREGLVTSERHRFLEELRPDHERSKCAGGDVVIVSRLERPVPGRTEKVQSVAFYRKSYSEFVRVPVCEDTKLLNIKDVPFISAEGNCLAIETYDGENSVVGVYYR